MEMTDLDFAEVVENVFTGMLGFELLRTHSDTERQFLEEMGAARPLVGERELAVSLARHALRHFAVPHDMEAVAARALGVRAPASVRVAADS